jgi:molybdenum cofactor synthesis domain-containing protein
LLDELGFVTTGPVVVPDDRPTIEGALRQGVSESYDLVVTTGGTGFAPRDVTPEATRAVIEREAPGLAEALRLENRDTIPTTILSRAVAGVAATTLIVNLPGSPGAVRDGVAVLAPLVGHAIAQLRGEDH